MAAAAAASSSSSFALRRPHHHLHPCKSSRASLLLRLSSSSSLSAATKSAALHRLIPSTKTSSALPRLLSVAAALTPELKSSLDKVVGSNKVVLFMKGNKDMPQCGFSATVVGILNSLNVPFETLDVLQSEALRQALKDYSNWPTFPQLYIDGEFFGGCDITVEAFKSGELQEVLERAMCS